MEIDIVTVNSSWEDLDYAVYVFKGDDPDRQIWKQLRDKPVTPQSIRELFIRGWRVNTSSFVTDGKCMYSIEEITINNNLSPFHRDVTLCHEIVHAHYPETANEPSDFYNACKKDHLEREFITEWEARRLRSNPHILRALARQFDGKDSHDYVFKPFIYDRATFLAFGLHGYDLDKAMKKCPRPLLDLPVFMDIPSDVHVQSPTQDDNDYEHYPNLLI